MSNQTQTGQGIQFKNKYVKIVYFAYLVLVGALALYWTLSQTGPAVPLIQFQAGFLNWGKYFGLMTFIVLVLPMGLVGQIVAVIVDSRISSKR